MNNATVQTDNGRKFTNTSLWPRPPLVCIFTVGTRAGHPSLLLSRLAGQLQGEGLVHLEGRLPLSGCQLKGSTLDGLDREVLLA